MNYPTIYDPRIADEAHERLTDGMIGIVNQNRKEARRAAAVRNTVAALQKAQAVQNAQNTRKVTKLQAKIRQLERKEKTRARWTRIGLDFMLLAASRIAYEAMCAGAIKFNLALPLALAATLYGGWLLCAGWQDAKRNRRNQL